MLINHPILNIYAPSFFLGWGASKFLSNLVEHILFFNVEIGLIGASVWAFLGYVIWGIFIVKILDLNNSISFKPKEIILLCFVLAGFGFPAAYLVYAQLVPAKLLLGLIPIQFFLGYLVLRKSILEKAALNDPNKKDPLNITHFLLFLSFFMILKYVL